jgi:hypothetical protein
MSSAPNFWARLHDPRFVVEVFALIGLAAYVNETRKSNTLLRQQLIGTQGAILIYDVSLNEGGLWLDVENKGHVAATDVKLCLKVYKRDLPSERDNETPVIYTLQQLVLPVASEGASGVNQIQQRYIPPGWSLNTFDAMKRTEQTIRVELSISYGNGFDKPRHAPSFCKSWLGYHTKNSIGGAVIVDRFIPCEGFDDAVRATIQAKREDVERSNTQQ